MYAHQIICCEAQTFFSVTAHSPNLSKFQNVCVYWEVCDCAHIIDHFQDCAVAKRDMNLFENTFCKSRTGDRWSLLNVKTLWSFYTEAPIVRVLQGFREVQFSPDKAPNDAYVSNPFLWWYRTKEQNEVQDDCQSPPWFTADLHCKTYSWPNSNSLVQGPASLFRFGVPFTAELNSIVTK